MERSLGRGAGTKTIISPERVICQRNMEGRNFFSAISRRGCAFRTPEHFMGCVAQAFRGLDEKTAGTGTLERKNGAI